MFLSTHLVEPDTAALKSHGTRHRSAYTVKQAFLRAFPCAGGLCSPPPIPTTCTNLPPRSYPQPPPAALTPRHQPPSGRPPLPSGRPATVTAPPPRTCEPRWLCHCFSCSAATSRPSAILRAAEPPERDTERPSGRAGGREGMAGGGAGPGSLPGRRQQRGDPAAPASSGSHGAYATHPSTELRPPTPAALANSPAPCRQRQL